LLETGSKIAILVVGHALEMAYQVRDKLQDQAEISPEIINIRSVKPLDYDYLDSLKDKFDLIVTIEHNSLTNGVGQLIKNYLKSQPLLNIGYPDSFITHGNVNKLYEEIGFTAQAITEKILKEIK
jgi:1-deoxy-D-xylulose-5-phosphate synthase